MTLKTTEREPPVTAHRSWLMSRVRGTDTRPERLIRSALHRLGYRYRLHVRGLSGRPDLVFPSRKKVVFIHGCFWHRHGRHCTKTTMPKTRVAFWTEKFDANRRRDRRNVRELRKAGWKVLIVWECQTQKLDSTMSKIKRFLDE